jgi:hypothetical protein
LHSWQTFNSNWRDVIAELQAIREASNQQASLHATRLGVLIASNSSADSVGGSSSSAHAATQIGYGNLYSDALVLCKALVAAVPLPVVCNNPGCKTLEGVSEVAGARKVCAGCRCRYCSAACQAADWKRQKKACKQMAAVGQACR